MNTSDYLAIAGIIISIAFGSGGFYFALRRRKYPGSIMFVWEEAIALLDDVATRLPNLAVLYNDAPIDKNVVLLRGYLLNNGSIDITPDMVEQPLTVKLPDGCIWLECTLTGVTEALHAEGEIISPRVLQITFAGLFRRDEAFSFRALVMVDAVQYAEPAEVPHWSHRIANLGVVKTVTMPVPEMSQRFKWIKIGKLLFFICSAIGFVMFSYWMWTEGGLFYECEMNGQKTIITFTNTVMTMADLATGNKQIVDLHPVPPPWDKDNLKSILLVSIVIILLSAMLLSLISTILDVYIDYRRYRMRKKLFAAVARKPGPREGRQYET